MSTLSVCLIAKNEEKNIGKCLESIQKIADEIIVVDTGSKDNTIEIARSYGAKVIQEAWENNFSKPRNTSLDHATMEWVLILDCDEYLLPDQAMCLKELIQSNPIEQGFHCKLVNLIKDQANVSAVVLRIFRNHPKHRFEGKMHEQIAKNIVETHGPHCIVAKDITIMHYGYDNSMVSQQDKSQRNLELLLNYSEKDKDGYYYYSLGNEYMRIEDFTESIRCYERAYELTEYKDNRVIYYAYLILHWMNAYYTLGYYSEMIDLSKRVEESLPHFRDLYFITALAYREVGLLWYAKEELEKHLTCQITYFEYPANQYAHMDAQNIFEVTAKEAVKPCVTGCYIIDHTVDGLVESIKNLHTIASEIYVVVRQEDQKRLEKDIERLEHMHVKVVYISTAIPQDDLSDLYKKLKQKWVVVLRDREIIPFTVASLLPEVIQNTNERNYYVTKVNLGTGNTNQEIRLRHIQKPSDLKQIPQKGQTSYVVIYEQENK